MKHTVDYIKDERGHPKTVQLSFINYKKLILKLEKYEQLLNIKSDLTRAFEEVKLLQQGKIKKQSLSEFLNEL